MSGYLRSYTLHFAKKKRKRRKKQGRSSQDVTSTDSRTGESQNVAHARHETRQPPPTSVSTSASSAFLIYSKIGTKKYDAVRCLVCSISLIYHTEHMSAKVIRPPKKHPGGRPTVMTPDVLRKLEEAASIDCSIDEMCFFSGISVPSLYDYWKKHPEHKERIEALRNSPVILARRTAVAKISESYTNAIDYLKRKRKNEFSERFEQTGADGKPLPILGGITKK